MQISRTVTMTDDRRQMTDERRLNDVNRRKLQCMANVYHDKSETQRTDAATTELVLSIFTARRSNAVLGVVILFVRHTRAL